MNFLEFETNPLPLNLLIFVIAASAVWIAGTGLSRYADEISERTGMTKAFTGLMLLAMVTSLPELATTMTAASIGNASLVRSNIFGGIAMQTALLAIADRLRVKGALTYVSPKPVLLMQGVLLIIMLSVATVVMVLKDPVDLWGMGLGAVLLFCLYVGFLYNSYHYPNRPKWKPVDEPETDRVHADEADSLEKLSSSRLYGSFLVASAVVVLAGWTVAQTADTIAQQTGTSTSLVGAVLVAISTSLPELSTTLSAVRIGAYGMAISNIFGSNALMLALFVPGDVVYDGILLRAENEASLFLIPVGIVVTAIYLWGLLERRNKTIFGVGIDSALVVLVYFGGLIALYLGRA